MNESQAKLAEKIARLAHNGQYRRDGKTPYITHPEDVARRLREKGARDEVIAAAWLHDVLEDTRIEEKTLIQWGVDVDIVFSVTVLTKQKEQSYQDYLRGVSNNRIASQVKIMDMISNLADSPSPRQVKKYAEGLSFLLTFE
jgi:(p)ppGpp synthase/HD superfamily hydrolase